MIRPYLAVAAVFAVLAALLAFGSDWHPQTFWDWAEVVGLIPAGAGGVLLGDRIGLWLKDHGIGRQ